LVIAHGSLELERAPAPALPDSWVQAGLLVRFRAGGERYQAAGAGQAVALREWMRTRGVLPWMRDAIPLLYHGRELVAVGDLSVSAAAAAEAGSAGGWRVVWRNRPRTD
jgi:tRNA(Ile)-lysidine synthase